MSREDGIPEGWEKRGSTTKPGRFFYYNLKLKRSVWRLSEVIDIESKLSNDQKPTYAGDTVPRSNMGRKTRSSANISSQSSRGIGKELSTHPKEFSSKYSPAPATYLSQKPSSSSSIRGRRAAARETGKKSVKTNGVVVAIIEKKEKQFSEMAEKAQLKSEYVSLDSADGARHSAANSPAYLSKLPIGCIGPRPSSSKQSLTATKKPQTSITVTSSSQAMQNPGKITRRSTLFRTGAQLQSTPRLSRSSTNTKPSATTSPPLLRSSNKSSPANSSTKSHHNDINSTSVEEKSKPIASSQQSLKSVTRSRSNSSPLQEFRVATTPSHIADTRNANQTGGISASHDTRSDSRTADTTASGRDVTSAGWPVGSTFYKKESSARFVRDGSRSVRVNPISREDRPARGNRQGTDVRMSSGNSAVLSPQNLLVNLQKVTDAVKNAPNTENTSTITYPGLGRRVAEFPPSTSLSMSADGCGAVSIPEDNNCEMIIDEEEAELSYPVSYSLASDIVMESLTNDAVMTAFDGPVCLQSERPSQRQHDQKPSHQDMFKLTLVVDTCSLGRLPSLLSMTKVELRESSSKQISAGDYVDYGKPRIIIPWQVLQEIDVLKDNKKKQFSSAKQSQAQKIAKLIHSKVSDSSSGLRLQSPMDDAEELVGFRIQTEDDHIIKCCLSIIKRRGEQHKVILITEDVNLINKCVACQVVALQYNSFLYMSHVSSNSISLKLNTSSSTKTNLQKNKPSLPQNTWMKVDGKAVAVPIGAKNSKIKTAVVAPTPSTQSASQPSSQQPITSARYHPTITPTPVSIPEEVKPLTSIHKQDIPSNQPECGAIIDKIKELLYLVLYTCVTQEMTLIFGTVWTAVIYRKPPWDTVIPILENMSRHWIAVFGHIVTRSLDKQVIRLLDLLSSSSCTAAGVGEAVVASIALMRGFDQADRPYSEKCRSVLPALSELASRCKELAKENKETETTTPHQVQGEQSQQVDAETSENGDAGQILTAIFSTLASACEKIDSVQAQHDALETVCGLGKAYNSALIIPLERDSVENFLVCLMHLSNRLGIQAWKLTPECLGKFISENRELLLDGFSQLELLAQNVQSLSF